MLPSLAGLDDRLNPVLVKEVRQALRQRIFLGSFLLGLGVAWALTSLLSSRAGPDEEGGPLLSLLHAALAMGCYIQVPLSAWVSMDAEWRGKKLDQILLSRMSMRDVLLGKLAAALVQVVLYLAAFLPFVAFAALASAVDLNSVRGAMIEVLARSTLLISLALVLGAMGRKEGTRSVAATGVALLGAALVAWQVRFFTQVQGSHFHLLTPLPTLFNQLNGAALELSAAAVLLCGAYGRLEHRAINTSSRIRVVVTGAVLALVARAWFYVGPPAHPYDWTYVHGVVAALVLLGPAAYFVTEPDRVERAHRRWIPSSVNTAALGSPWIPGGGRGVLFLTTHLALLTVGTAMGLAYRKGGGALVDGLTPGLATALAGYAVMVVPTTILLDMSNAPRTRRRLRMIIPLFSLVVGVLITWAAAMDPDAGVGMAIILGGGPIAFVVGAAQSMSGMQAAMQDARLSRYWRRREGRRRQGSRQVLLSSGGSPLRSSPRSGS